MSNLQTERKFTIQNRLVMIKRETEKNPNTPNFKMIHNNPMDVNFEFHNSKFEREKKGSVTMLFRRFKIGILASYHIRKEKY